MRTAALFLFLSSLCLAQQTELVDFQRVGAHISVNKELRQVQGTAEVSFRLLRDTDSIYMDAADFHLQKASAGPGMAISNDERKIWFTGDLRKDSLYAVSFEYRVVPRQALYFTGQQVWTQGQGKYSSHWLPSLDDMNDKIEFDLSFAVAKGDKVVSNGLLTDVRPNARGEVWSFDMDKPMASYLAAFAMGDFEKLDLRSASGVPIELYFSANDSLKAEPTYRHTVEIFDFLEDEIGVAYPWPNYKQVPVRDFLYAGMENTTATIFSEAFVVDSIGYADRNYVNVNAHELAHQWFGNLVTETSGTHHWLQEGFATYYAQLAEGALFGEEYLYWKLYQSAEQLKALSDEGKGERLLDPGASSLTFYEKGAWALHVLRDRIGDTAFRRAVIRYLETHSYGNVDTDDFIRAVQAETAEDISSWERDWLQQTAFPARQAFEYLRRSPFMQQYFQLFNLRGTAFSDRIAALAEAIDSGNEYLGQEAVYQLAAEDMDDSFILYRRAMESPNLYIRQAVILSVPEVVPDLRPYFEKALDDPSYLSREYALLRLWSAFPERAEHYLDRLEGQLGFQDRNLRQLWLALAIYTPAYRPADKEAFKAELLAYATPEYSFELRRKAFEYLGELGIREPKLIDALVDGCLHHNWRFRKTMRERLQAALDEPGVVDYLRSQMGQYPAAQQAYLKTVIPGS